MKYCFTLLIEIIFNTFISISQSWLYPESIIPLNPLIDTTNRMNISFLRTSQFWGEGGMYVGYRDTIHRWDPTIGGTIELIGKQNWNIVYETSVHLIVDPENNISFNPRAFVWEEGILFTTQSGNHFWHFGYQHRCKHDVDNIERLHTTGLEEQRSLIYGSAVIRWDHLPYKIYDWEFYPLAEFHLYLLVQDQRFPDNTRSIESNIGALNSAFRLHSTIKHLISTSMRYGFTADIRFSAFGSLPREKRFSRINHIHTDPAVESFWEFVGVRASLQCFVRYAYQSDNFVTPIPASSSLLAVGVRIIPNLSSGF